MKKENRQLLARLVIIYLFIIFTNNILNDVLLVFSALVRMLKSGISKGLQFNICQ